MDPSPAVDSACPPRPKAPSRKCAPPPLPFVHRYGLYSLSQCRICSRGWAIRHGAAALSGATSVPSPSLIKPCSKPPCVRSRRIGGALCLNPSTWLVSLADDV
eukprot:5322134-Prymnesium_polylepis.1